MIISKDNKQFKLWKKLKSKKYRDALGLFLVYGEHLIQKAQAYGAVQALITSNPAKEGLLIDTALMLELSQTQTAFDMMAVCKHSDKKNESLRILALDDVQDPANVGALVRSAAAFGFNHILFSIYSADIYNEKTIRSSQGSIFDVSFERGHLPTLLKMYQHRGYEIYTADAHGKGHFEVTAQPLIIVLGNEGAGISKEVKELASASITIKTQQVESLNVAVAGSILMYEWGQIK